MDRVVRASYYIFFLSLVIVAVFKVATPLITVLFSFFALSHFKFYNRVWIAVVIFLVVVSLIGYGFGFFIKETIDTLPQIAVDSVPIMLEYANKYGLVLPFTDVESFKVVAVESVRDEMLHVAKFLEIGIKELVYLLIGLVVAVSIFVSGQLDLNQGKYKIQNNLYTVLSSEIANRFRNFYQSFVTVMGAQLIISLINTVFTGIFVLAIALPYGKVVVGITFLCGLLPIVGNVISNTIIFGIAITVSLRLAVIALIFLIVLHKFEYFLNSRIVGGRIKNPMWLTLLGLIVGEKLMGIPGMILAPVILHYLKMEGSQIEVKIA